MDGSDAVDPAAEDVVDELGRPIPVPEDTWPLPTSPYPGEDPDPTNPRKEV